MSQEREAHNREKARQHGVVLEVSNKGRGGVDAKSR